MNCDECKREITPNRVIVVKAGSPSRPGRPGESYTFCLLCHPVVFTECDFKKYPALFDEWCNWDDALGEWNTAQELGRLTGLTPKTLSNRIRGTGMLLGWEVEADWAGRIRKYKLIGPEGAHGADHTG